MNLISQKKRSISVAPTTSRLTRSTTVTLPTRSSPTRETVLTPIHAHALSRTLPHPAVQHGPSSMNLNQPLSCRAIRRHLGCQKVLGVGAGHLPRVSDDRPTRGACRQIKTSRIVRVKLGRQIRGLGNGLLRDIGESSSNVRHMEKELEAERAAQKAADAALMKTEQRMQKKLKVVGQKFNATLQS
ncbi:hypothetical protein LWI29_001152 [Acer saccharum]|uniref:Uncharacterized protein n=1 Tax=Acer saccharum TaxID=4024 RepID=A0AA39RG69_ACESA|nr:hypothetical protein LWI29_001152 [Acer saccharum]